MGKQSALTPSQSSNITVPASKHVKLSADKVLKDSFKGGTPTIHSSISQLPSSSKMKGKNQEMTDKASEYKNTLKNNAPSVGLEPDDEQEGASHASGSTGNASPNCKDLHDSDHHFLNDMKPKGSGKEKNLNEEHYSGKENNQPDIRVNDQVMLQVIITDATPISKETDTQKKYTGYCKTLLANFEEEKVPLFAK
ncbi:hypothetical protein GYMLUDRAFT_61832 [Collybiopsis luxurians FD-317 M1]|uniref:Unplaced genomic scaffold GYMLUscaffold_47, whole genome shotgun sequence n=1 Tax=Collybiopsis luxurians FD-317 M1 TaxID=944289 RepID=A0A0D0CFD3_9AGAR|nr:hypothetical protein GYMLUDRAFT_61832 [Collybiopsis luxurians FD-317 M1]